MGLFRTGLPLISIAASAAAGTSTRRISIGGLFCHQSPKIRIESGGVCEIGDLLVVVRHETPSTVEHRALLVQTKMEGRGGLLAGDPQYELYARWPTFDWLRTGDRRSVEDPRPHQGGQFGVIEVCTVGCSQCTADVAVPGNIARSLSGEIHDMLFLNRGREFDEAHSVAATIDTGWTRVVWDLLRFTVGSVAYNYRAAGERSSPRDFNTSGIFLARGNLDLPGVLSPLEGEADLQALKHAWASPEAFPPPPAQSIPELSQRDDDDPGGISILAMKIAQEN